MTTDKTVIIDLTLSSQTARKRGYEYIDDVFYDGAKTLEEIIELLSEHGYKLGKPSKQSLTDSYYGFYAPIKPFLQ